MRGNGRMFLVPAAAVLLAASAAEAQQSTPPPGWRWQLDAPAVQHLGGVFTPSDSLFEFALMAPGWHITMGPGASLYDPRESASGRFIVAGEMIVFPNSSNAEYGVFVGGADLEGEAASWTGFVVRADGSAAVLRRERGATTLLMPWARHEAVKVREEGGSARNDVAVHAEPDSVRFVVNGTRVGAWPRASLRVDGVFGFRIGRGVNLHSTNLDVTRRLAPFPIRQ